MDSEFHLRQTADVVATKSAPRLSPLQAQPVVTLGPERYFLEMFSVNDDD